MQHRSWAVVGAATASLVAAVLVPNSPALAATGIVTQSSPISVAHEGGSKATAETTSFFTITPDGASSTLALAAPADAVVTSVFVRIHVQHPKMDELDLVLEGPGERRVVLASDIGGDHVVNGPMYVDFELEPFADDAATLESNSGSPVDYDTTDGDLDPIEGNASASLADFGGALVAGPWTLQAVDDSPALNVGFVPAWRLEVTYGIPALPSSLDVTGMPQQVADVDLVLNDVAGTSLAHTELLLESPDGRYAHVLSDIADADGPVDVDFLLDDEAGVDLPADAIPAFRSYRPGNYDGHGLAGSSTQDLTEPIGGVETIGMDAKLSAFDGGPANGTWKLWVLQEHCCASVTIGSWALQITTDDPPPLPPAPAAPSGLPAPAAADRTAPTVATTTPTHRAKGVKTGASVKVVFSEAMRATSLSKRTITLVSKAGGKVTATLAYKAGRHLLIVNPQRTLAAGTTYRLTVKTGVRDRAGNPLAREKKVSFQTR